MFTLPAMTDVLTAITTYATAGLVTALLGIAMYIVGVNVVGIVLARLGRAITSNVSRVVGGRRGGRRGRR